MRIHKITDDARRETKSNIFRITIFLYLLDPMISYSEKLLVNVKMKKNRF